MDGQSDKLSSKDYHDARQNKRDEAEAATLQGHPAEYKGKSPIKINKLGHFVYEVTDVERTAKFWREVMNFQETDRNEIGMVFLRCGADHHAIGLKPSQSPRRPKKGEFLRMEHLAFEVDSPEELLAARDWLKENGFPIAFEGRKGAGGNMSLHFNDPDGYEFEIYCDMDQIDRHGLLRPEAQFRRANSLEEAISHPLPPKKW
ncbi:MAG: hypothetical protein RLZ98_30 [Pseudomonadota bacterium]|jgi:catechol 2,3-dioxygenase